MVRKEHKLLGQEIVALVSRCLNDGVELLIVRGVPESNVIQLFAEELDGTPLMPTPEASQATSNTLLKSGNRKTGAWVIKAFNR